MKTIVVTWKELEAHLGMIGGVEGLLMMLPALLGGGALEVERIVRPVIDARDTVTVTCTVGGETWAVNVVADDE